MNNPNRKRALRVRVELLKRGITLKDLAARIGISDRMIFYVLRGERSSLRVQQGIAGVLGISFEKLWGSK
jgi:transcriptional regulator with XRE-family HTH domain